MRQLLIILICLGALVGGALLGAFCMEHPFEVARLWNASNTVSGLAVAAVPPALPASPNQPESAPPPQPLPAQANWTWQTLDGKTYDNVVITHLSPTEVTITHSLGVAHLPLTNLPPDIQQQLQGAAGSPQPHQ